jgi:hypothetical protein
VARRIASADMSSIDRLKELLIDCIIEDLNDPEKRTPGLYQVAARVVSDNKPDGNQIPIRQETLDSIVPFKLKKA